MQVYPGTWSTTAQGGMQKALPTQTQAAQWKTNTPEVNGPIALFVRAADQRLIIKAWHAQLLSRSATQLNRQFTAPGSAPTQSSMVSDVYEWQFPPVLDAPGNTTVSGTGTIVVGGSYIPMHPAASNEIANCTWLFTRGSVPVSPIAAPGLVTAPATPRIATLTPVTPTTPTSTVTTLPPTVTATPNNVPQGQQGATVELAGKNTSFQQGTTTADFGAGIAAVSLTVHSATDATAVINIDPTAKLGPRALQLNTNSEHAPVGKIMVPGMGNPMDAFSVRVANPHVAPNPTDVPLGQQGVTIALTGYDTSFQQGVTTADFCPGITVVSLTVNSSTSATAVINVGPGARPGPCPLQLATNNEHAYALVKVPGVANPTTAFSVRQAYPYVDANPTDVPLGQQGAIIALTGHDTSFQPGVTTADFCPGVTLVSLTLNSGTSATAVINVGPGGLKPGPCPLQLTTNNEHAYTQIAANGVTLGKAFYVRQAFPYVDANPTDVPLGQQGAIIALTGHDTSFQPGVTTADFGPGITLVSLTVNSGTSATAVINVDPGAKLGPCPLQLTTNNEHAYAKIVVNAVKLGTAFSVRLRALYFIPNPATVAPGQQGVIVELTSHDSNFQSGVTTADFGAGITVVSLTVNSKTSATAVLNVDPTATVGRRPAQLTTAAEKVPVSRVAIPGSSSGAPNFSVTP